MNFQIKLDVEMAIINGGTAMTKGSIPRINLVLQTRTEEHHKGFLITAT